LRPEPLPESGKHVGIDTGERRASQEQLGNTRHPDPRLDPEAEQAGVAEFRQPESAGGLLREHAAAGAGVQQKPPRRPRAEKDRDAGPPVGEEAERHDAHTGTPRDAALVGEPGLAPAKIDRDAERGKERHAEEAVGALKREAEQAALDMSRADQERGVAAHEAPRAEFVDARANRRLLPAQERHARAAEDGQVEFLDDIGREQVVR